MHGCSEVVPRRFRRRFFDNPVAKWLVPAWRCIALPVADNRKRFLVALCVFIFGLELGLLAIGKRLHHRKTERAQPITGLGSYRPAIDGGRAPAPVFYRDSPRILRPTARISRLLDRTEVKPPILERPHRCYPSLGSPDRSFRNGRVRVPFHLPCLRSLQSRLAQPPMFPLPPYQSPS